MGFTVPEPFSVSVWLGTTSVWVPLEPPIDTPANVASTSSVTEYVPVAVITTLSALVGIAPVLQFDAVLHAPPAAFVQYTVAGAVRTSNGILVMGGKFGVENTSVYCAPG